MCLSALGVPAAGSGCAGRERTARWKQWEYDESQVQTPAQQIEAHHGRQRDSSALTAPARSVPTEMLSNTMTEGERRRLQQRLADEMRDLAQRQRDDVAEFERQGANPPRAD